VKLREELLDVASMNEDDVDDNSSLRLVFDMMPVATALAKEKSVSPSSLSSLYRSYIFSCLSLRRPWIVCTELVRLVPSVSCAL
jgi:hypothetical protein